jgi:hypothetical protein
VLNYQIAILIAERAFEILNLGEFRDRRRASYSNFLKPQKSFFKKPAGKISQSDELISQPPMENWPHYYCVPVAHARQSSIVRRWARHDPAAFDGPQEPGVAQAIQRANVAAESHGDDAATPRCSCYLWRALCGLRLANGGRWCDHVCLQGRRKGAAPFSRFTLSPVPDPLTVFACLIYEGSEPVVATAVCYA